MTTPTHDSPRPDPESSELDAARLSRRRALKAAAATGIGVTAWAVPSIKSVGGTPAYALACSQPGPFEVTEDGNGANINCSTACANLLSFGWLGAGNNSRNFSGSGVSGTLTFLDPTPECSDIPRVVDIVATRDSDGADLACTLTGVFVEAINNTTPVPAEPLGSTPRIQDGAPAPIGFAGSDYTVVDAESPTGYSWIGVNKNGGIGNICSSQWLVQMECTVIGC